MSSKFTAKVNKGREKIRATMRSHFQSMQEKKADPFAITAPEEVCSAEIAAERQYYQQRKRSRPSLQTYKGD